MKGGNDLRATSSLALLAEVTATKNAVFKVSSFRSDVATGSNGGRINALRTIYSDH